MDYVALLKNDITRWNEHRKNHPHATYRLAGEDLSQGYFFEGDFSNLDLQGVNLNRACLIGADFRGANLTDANLEKAYLSEATLCGANLNNANLTGADLNSADLRKVNLSGARLLNADLTNSITESAEESHAHTLGNEKQQQPSEPQRIRPRAKALLQQINQQLSWPPRRAFTLATGSAIALLATLGNTVLPPIANNLLPISLPTHTVADTPLTPADSVQSAGQSADQNVTRPKPTASLALDKSLNGSSQVWSVATHTQQDGNTLVIGGHADGRIEIWDRQTGQTLNNMLGHDDTVRTLAISASGKWLVSGSGDGLKVWEVETGTLIYSIPPEQSPVWSVAISPDEKTFVSSDYSGNIAAWDLATGEQQYRNTIGAGVPVWSVSIAPDGLSFVSGSGDRMIRQWDLASGKLLKEFSGHTDAVRAVTISPDGQTLASASWDNTIKLWNLASGSLSNTLNGHSNRVVTLAISADGTTLASGSVDSTVKLWDLTAQQLSETLEMNSNWILSVTFDRLEQTLISSGKDQMIRVWQEAKI